MNLMHPFKNYGPETKSVTTWTTKKWHGGSDFRLYDGSDLKTYLLMRW